MLFLNTSLAGKSSHKKLGKLVSKPLKKLKDALEEPKNNDTNFCSLLLYRAKNCDNVLVKYFETNGGKSIYTSPLIQNEIINLFENLIK
jgi:hypothetical protein